MPPKLDRRRLPPKEPVPPCKECGLTGSCHPNSAHGRPARTHGLCRRCYDRAWTAAKRNGQTTPPKRTPKARRTVPLQSCSLFEATCSTDALPGSPEKMEVLARRFEWKQPMDQPGDYGFVSGYLSLLRFVRLDQSA